MTETIIETVLNGNLDPTLLIKWLDNDYAQDTSEDCVLLGCSRTEFVAHFLSYLRKQTDSIVHSSPLPGTPERSLARQHHRSISDPTYEADRSNNSLVVQQDRQRSHESPGRDKKRPGRRVKTKLFHDDKKDTSLSSDDSRLSHSVEKLTLSSTPLKNGLKITEYQNLGNLTSPVTPHSKSYERCDTPRLGSRHTRSQEKSCLGDYLISAQKDRSKKKKSRHSSDDSDIKTELDLSNSDMFPEIGARKSNSLITEKRRIKPTHIDKSKKSLSLNSFNSDCFQQPSSVVLEENAAFKQENVQPKEFSNSFDAERSILKKERHKLMEKFNILNTESPKCVSPQIKLIKKDSFEKVQTFIKADVTRVIHKEKLDFLVEIYEVLMRNNLILTMNAEINFLITVLLSQQAEDECAVIEMKLQENISENLLKTIHNSTYFAVQTLWCQRTMLELILDKNSLKLLGDNKSVRGFLPDLAKYLLNAYSLKCESEVGTQKPSPEPKGSNGVVCFNQETDNIDNFSSMLSFQNFKKQRDMFYEIYRWYGSLPSPPARPALRQRAKALAAAGRDTHAALAHLVITHLLQQTLQECRLSKLERRLTRPSGARALDFNANEMFYKELLECLEWEGARAHVRDALIAALLAPPETKDYLQLVKRQSTLGRFLGHLASLPYRGREKEEEERIPKQRVLDNALAVRSYTQPPIDLKGILKEAMNAGRLAIVMPWLTQYLAMLDYVTLRTKYYQELLKIIFDIYMNKLKVNQANKMHKNTVIYLKSTLAWLFALPHFPIDLFYERREEHQTAVEAVDTLDLVPTSSIPPLCPWVRAGALLRGAGGAGGTGGRHVTPVSLLAAPRDREKEMQNRLEEALIKSQPSWARRALDMTADRCAALARRELAAAAGAARERARAATIAVIRGKADGCTHEQLLTVATATYSSALEQALQSSAGAAGAAGAARAAAALGALGAAQLRAAAARRVTNAVSGACLPPQPKEIETEVQTLLALHERGAALSPGAGALSPATMGSAIPSPGLLIPIGISSSPSPRGLGTPNSAGTPNTPGSLNTPGAPKTPGAQSSKSVTEGDSTNYVSAADTIILLKDQICNILTSTPTPSLSTALALARAAPRVCGVAGVAEGGGWRPPARAALVQLSVDLAVVMASHRPHDVTESFLNQLRPIWGAPNNTAPTSDKPSNKKHLRITITENTENTHLEYFERILCSRNIVLLTKGEKQSEVWEAMSRFLVFLLKNQYLNEDSLTEQCLAVYRQDWPQSTLSSLSTCMRGVSSRWSGAGKFALFLDFLAEYCRDLDLDLDLE